MTEKTMQKTMLLRDVHPDVQRYLEEDCYCPYEVYEPNGFFFDLFYPDIECVLVAKTDTVAVVIACGEFSQERPQCLVFFYGENDYPSRIVNAQCVDATENNIAFLRDYASGKTVRELTEAGRRLDEYEPGSTARSLKQMFSLADAVIYD